VAGPPEWLPKLAAADDVGYLVATNGSQPSLFVEIIWIPLKNYTDLGPWFWFSLAWCMIG